MSTWLGSFLIGVCQLSFFGTASVRTHDPLVLCMLLVECAQLDLIKLGLESGAHLGQINRLDTLGLLVGVMPE